MRILLGFIIISILPFFVAEEELNLTPNDPNVEYCNTRYHFCVEYSPSLLPEKCVSDNGDGIILNSKDKDLKVTISGSRSILERDCWELFDDFVSDDIYDPSETRVIYRVITERYYKTSFIRGDRLFYQKLFHEGNKFVLFQVEAPKDERSRMDNVRKNIELSFAL